MSITPDVVCRKYARKKTKITIRQIEPDGDIFLIEGERDGLEFLGNLLLAQARSEDCGFQLARQGAGKAFFTKTSTAGLYIHRLHRAATRPKRNNSRPDRAQKRTPAIALSAQ